MTASNFERALSLVLVHEGGYVDHPSDPGGATNLGITIGTLKAWRGKPVSKADVKALTKAEAGLIYRRNYWDQVRGDELPTGLDYAVFDFAVNSGVSRAVKYLQASLGVAQDGKLGPVTLTEATRSDTAEVIDDLCDRRLAYLKRLKTWPTFGKGWTRRVSGVRRDALAMLAMLATPPPAKPIPVPKPGPVPEAPVSEHWFAVLVRFIAKLLGR